MKVSGSGEQNKERHKYLIDWVVLAVDRALLACNLGRLKPAVIGKDAGLLGREAVLWLVMCACNVNHVQIFWEGTNKHC